MACNLSGGNQQKVVLAKWLASNPEVLILDEPTSGLDPFSRDELMEVFQILKEHGVTIFFSTHIISDLERCADHIIYISNGEIKVDCSMMEFMQRNGRQEETLEESILRLEREARS